MITLYDLQSLHDEFAHVEARIQEISPHAFVTLGLMWFSTRDAHLWHAKVYTTEPIESLGETPEDALRALSHMVERRVASQQALARTLGIEAAA
jgi:hypothetical protein